MFTKLGKKTLVAFLIAVVSIVLWIAGNVYLSSTQTIKVKSFKKRATDIEVVLVNDASSKVYLTEVKVNGKTVWKASGSWDSNYGIFVVVGKKAVFLTKAVGKLEIPAKSECSIWIKSAELYDKKTHRLEFVTSKGTLSVSVPP